MQVKEIDITTGKIKRYGICKKKYKISFLGGPTTPTYSNTLLNVKEYNFRSKPTEMLLDRLVGLLWKESAINRATPFSFR